MTTRSKLYFGRPINVMGSNLDVLLAGIITACFPDWEIEDPSLPEHAAGYEKWKKEHGNGMEYYRQEVLPYCRGGIFLCFRDGTWGAGTYTEAKFFVEHGLPVWVISPKGRIRGCSPTEFQQEHLLSIEETRTRIRDEQGNLTAY